jgi:hypothetical protein
MSPTQNGSKWRSRVNFLYIIVKCLYMLYIQKTTSLTPKIPCIFFVKILQFLT